MPAPQTSYYNFVSGATAVVTTAETVIATTRAISSPFAGASFAVEFACDFLTGATVTGVTLRVRQVSVTGTAVYTGPVVAAAAATQLPRIYVATVDAPVGEVASFVYVLTIVQAAATGNGSATNAYSKVTVAE